MSILQEQPMPPQDPRDHTVLVRPEIDPYRATEASKAYSKAKAAEERAEVDAIRKELNARQLVGVLAVRELVKEWGVARVVCWARNAPEMGEL